MDESITEPEPHQRKGPVHLLAWHQVKNEFNKTIEIQGMTGCGACFYIGKIAYSVYIEQVTCPQCLDERLLLHPNANIRRVGFRLGAHRMWLKKREL